MKGILSLAMALLMVVAVPLSGADSTALVSAGEAALAAEDWADAEVQFRRALSADGRSAEAQIGLAHALAGAGDPAAGAAGLLRGAQRWSDTGDYPAAARLLETATDLKPDDPTLLAALGRALVLARRYLAAEPPLARLFEAGVADAEALLYYGATLWENGKLAEAEAVARVAVESSGGAFPALYQLGRLLLWQSRYPEAATYLERSASLAPASVDVRLDLARALDGAGREAASIEVFRQAVALAPEHSEVRYGLAMALQRAGDREAAATELATYRTLYEADQARTRAAGLTAARIARGRELLESGRVADAIDHLRSLPLSADGLATLAAALRSKGDLEGAVEVLDRAVALDSSRTDLRALLNETRLELLRR